MHQRRTPTLETEWIFDVQEIDDENPSNTILQELEIDVELIFLSIKWMLSYPWCWIIFPSSSNRVHPLASPLSQREFWGPCFVVCMVVMPSSHIL
jgi:hypothetical protein